jgi:hypothetical protein
VAFEGMFPFDFPVPVMVNLFLAPDTVFIFGML